MYMNIYVYDMWLCSRFYKSKMEAINRSGKWRIKDILGAKLAALIAFTPPTAFALLVPLLAGTGELPDGTTPPVVEFEIKTTTSQSSSEPIPTPVYLGSFRELE